MRAKSAKKIDTFGGTANRFVNLWYPGEFHVTYESVVGDQEDTRIWYPLIL